METKEKDKILNLIVSYKEEGNQDTLIALIDCMAPIINKYSKNAYFMEYDDAQQEYKLAIIEAVIKMKKYDRCGACVVYITNAVKNRFYELNRRNNDLKNEQSSELQDLEQDIQKNVDPYCELEFKMDVWKLTKCSSQIQEKIKYYFILEDLTDAEIAERLNVSRQYVNKCKKEIFNKLVNY